MVGEGDSGGSNPPQDPCFFFWNSPLLNGFNLNLGNVFYSGKFSKLGEKKSLIKQKKQTLSKITAPVSTSSVSFEAVLSNKDESCNGQLFMRVSTMQSKKRLSRQLLLIK